MKSKYFHETKIKELEFQRNRRKSKEDKYFAAVTSLLSVVTVFLMFELQSKEKDVRWLVILGITFFILMAILYFMPLRKYPEDKQIQEEFAILLDLKRRERKQGNKQHKQKI